MKIFGNLILITGVLAFLATGVLVFFVDNVGKDVVIFLLLLGLILSGAGNFIKGRAKKPQDHGGSV